MKVVVAMSGDATGLQVDGKLIFRRHKFITAIFGLSNVIKTQRRVLNCMGIQSNGPIHGLGIVGMKGPDRK